MKRSGFKRKVYERAPQPLLIAGPEFKYATAALFRAPVPKDEPLQHEVYMDVVRALPCARCSIVGFTQFCHADESKGMGIKTDCRLGWPGCGPSFNNPGCHWYVGTSGRMGKQERRLFEQAAGVATRYIVDQMGLWPAELPKWEG